MSERVARQNRRVRIRARTQFCAMEGCARMPARRRGSRMWYCEEHRQEHADRELFRRFERLISGLCTYCGNQPTPGMRTCIACRHQRAGYRKKYRNANVCMGLCKRCGRERRPGYKLCERCQKKARAQKAA